MIKKKSYQNSALEVIGFESEDIIITGVGVGRDRNVEGTEVPFE